MLGTREVLRDQKMFLYVVTSLVMSGYDAVATVRHVSRGVALEGNPLMAPLVEGHAVGFFLVKMALTAVGLIVCYYHSHLRAGRLGLKLTVAVYLLVSVYHVLITFLG
jgi:hypothetical protein